MVEDDRGPKGSRDHLLPSRISVDVDKETGSFIQMGRDAPSTRKLTMCDWDFPWCLWPPSPKPVSAWALR